MKKMFLKSVAAVAWLVVAGCSATAFSFLLALIIKCVVRGWKLGWMLVALLLVTNGALAQSNTNGTPLLFSVRSLTGSVANRPILITPDTYQNPLLFGTNLVSSFAPFYIQPVGGQVITNLQPWGYTIKVDGWPRSAHINVPSSTNVINVVTLINTNNFSPLVIQMLGDNAAGTNVNLSGTFTGIGSQVGDKPLIVTNPFYSNNRGRYFWANYRSFGVLGTNSPDGFGNGNNFVWCDVDSGGYGHISLGGPAGVVYLGNSLGQITAPGSIQGSDFVGANSYQSANGGTNIDANGNFFGNGAGLTNLTGDLILITGGNGVVSRLGQTVISPSGNFQYDNGVVAISGSGTFKNYDNTTWHDQNGNIYGLNFNGNGSGLTNLAAPNLTGTISAARLPLLTNQINSVSGVITNGGVVWYFLNTNNTPAISAPWGSLCSTTNGQLYIRSNTVWLLK
jgi:hypothetical protein